MKELEYLVENFSVVKCDSKKTSIQKHNKNDYRKPTYNQVLQNHVEGGSTAILAGERSNNLECLDFDTKNAKNATEFYETFCEVVALKLSQAFVSNIVIQSTPSGGKHWLYYVEGAEGNKKLCKGSNGQAIIETRKNGGYFVVAPSKGYKIIQGGMDSIPVITTRDKEILAEISASLSEYEEPERIIRKEAVKTHGALSNIHHDANGQINYWVEFDKNCDFLTMLERDGWTRVKPSGDKYLMRRPDKSEGHSADLHLHHEYGQLLYVYTTSTILESEKAYLPSTYLIEWHCQGDTIKAYDWLIDNNFAPSRKEKPEIKEMESPPETKDEASDIFKKYEEYRIDEKTIIPRPIPIIEINNVGVLHTGELLTISGESKAGKSALVSAMISKVLNANSDGFNIIKTERTEFPILHFDTEQPVHRHQDNLKYSIMKRAGLSSLPEQFMSYNLRRLSVVERKLMVSELIESARLVFGGVFMVVLDGIADFILDTNSNTESASIVTWALEMSTEYNCGVVSIIHLNPSADGYVKQRGHLGSELQRKTDSMLVVKMDQMVEGESTLLAHFLRNGGIKEFGQHNMYYDSSTGMHQLSTQETENALSPMQRYESISRQINGLTKAEAVKKLVEQGDYKSLKLAAAGIKELIDYNLIAMNDNDHIVMVTG